MTKQFVVILELDTGYMDCLAVCARFQHRKTFILNFLDNGVDISRLI